MKTPNDSIIEAIQKAHTAGWAIGQFNMSNAETLKAIVQAANLEKSPLIVGVSMGTIRHLGLQYIKGLMEAAREEAEVPLWFHIDHAPDFSIIQQCVDIGVDSVMIDTSTLPFEENVARVKPVVEFARKQGIGVEAQIGVTWDEETGAETQAKTDPNEVKNFVEATQIDYLAFSFGNTPGRIEGESHPDVELIEKIASRSTIPIVIHGGSSVPENAMKQAIQCGASKINIDTVIRKAVNRCLTEIFRDNPDIPKDPRVTFKKMREAVTDVVRSKMRLFGSSDKFKG
jgi:fructose-bisphosphate aldolase class II